MRPRALRNGCLPAALTCWPFRSGTLDTRFGRPCGSSSSRSSPACSSCAWRALPRTSRRPARRNSGSSRWGQACSFSSGPTSCRCISPSMGFCSGWRLSSPFTTWAQNDVEWEKEADGAAEEAAAIRAGGPRPSRFELAMWRRRPRVGFTALRLRRTALQKRCTAACRRLARTRGEHV